MRDAEGMLLYQGADISFVTVDPNAISDVTEMAPVRDEQIEHTPSTLEFQGLTYEVDVGKGKKAVVKKILKDVSGYVEAGHVLAIMGASGAGKTTLLNLLAGTLSAAGGGRTGGSVLVNGAKRDFASFRTLSSYLMQQVGNELAYVHGQNLSWASRKLFGCKHGGLRVGFGCSGCLTLFPARTPFPRLPSRPMPPHSNYYLSDPATSTWVSINPIIPNPRITSSPS